MGLHVLQNVDEFAKWIPNIKPAHAPRLAGGAVLSGNRSFDHFSQGFIKIINFNGEVWYAHTRTTFCCEADLDMIALGLNKKAKFLFEKKPRGRGEIPSLRLSTKVGHQSIRMPMPQFVFCLEQAHQFHVL
jgi:hypothetical protein